MFFNVGDYVSRNSYNNDTIFQILKIDGDLVYLRGVNIRLYADSHIEDLKLEKKDEVIDDQIFFDRMDQSFSLDRSEYFYLPGKILHLDGSEEYLERCLNFYKRFHIMAYGVCVDEEKIHEKNVKICK